MHVDYLYPESQFESTAFIHITMITNYNPLVHDSNDG